MTLAATLKDIRALREMSLSEVAKAASLTKAHVWELEVGRSRNPSVSTIFGLAIALQVDPRLLFDAGIASLYERKSQP